jgi:xylan 1,4-beta-xylosidase
MPEFTCELGRKGSILTHFWEHTVGSGHAPLGLRADWQRQLERAHRELGFGHVRFHGILSDRMGTLIMHKEQFLYSFFNADQIFDFLLSIGMRPFVELSFMPRTLATGGETVIQYEGNITPPRDYGAWEGLIEKLVAHWVDRYGAREVRTWFFECWNEPNLEAFWTGSRDDYFRLYRHTARAVKRVDPELAVGGPSSAKNEWIPEFLEFCERERLPVDFVTTHHYPTDAFGQIGDDTIDQLAAARRSILREDVQNARAKAGDHPLYYTEWNTSSNPRDRLHDEPYSAAFVTKTVMEANGIVDGYSFWTFSDIFEENYAPSVPFHGGFGLLTLHGIPKPSYRAFELLHGLGDEVLTVDGQHETVDAWVARRGDRVTVLLANGALPRHPIATEVAVVRLEGAPVPRSAIVRRIDEEHANPRCVWVEMGEPGYLAPREVDALEAASALAAAPHPFEYAEGAVSFSISLPPQGVAAVTLELGETREP